jgi:hypothetical protein
MRCGDLIGGRVVCNNTEDVYRFAELLKERLPDDGPFEVQDWIKQPSKRGYRALHINFRLNVSDDFVPEYLPCELQIKTRLQDAWGELTHDDIYKPETDLPEDLPARAKDLAEVLAAADKIASDIRKRALQEATAPTKKPALGVVSANGLAFVFREIFGRSPPDYVVRRALNICEDLEITSLERLYEVLARSDFRESLDKAYRAIMPVRARAEDLFLAALHALARSDRHALRFIRRRARSDFREIDAVYRREMLSSLPHSLDELMADLEEPGRDPNVESWAEALEVPTRNCRICGTTIIRPDAFAEAVVRYYEPSDPADIEQRIETALYQSGVECGGWGDSSLCAYHNEQAGKD